MNLWFENVANCKLQIEFKNVNHTTLKKFYLHNHFGFPSSSISVVFHVPFIHNFSYVDKFYKALVLTIKSRGNGNDDKSNDANDKL